MSNQRDSGQGDSGYRVRGADYSRLDFDRHKRQGVPEIILTDTKSVEQSMTIAAAFLERNGRAILSRVPDSLYAALMETYTSDGIIEWHEASRMAVLRSGTFEPEPIYGRVGVITAGTSDQPRAEEAAVTSEEMGCEVDVAYDAGVAGLHRLFGPLDHMVAQRDVDVIIVAAGMDGALPSVVSGLVDVPVIGLPTSVGYGFGGSGEAALMSMLQTCAPGLAVVNIDNGVGAGIMASLIARRAAKAATQTEG